MSTVTRALFEEADKLMLAQRRGHSMRKMLTTLKKLDLFNMMYYSFGRMDDQEWSNMGAPDADFVMRIVYIDEDGDTQEHLRCL